MRAENHLDPCDEECKFNCSGTCCYGLRNKIGCFLDPGAKDKLEATGARMLRNRIAARVVGEDAIELNDEMENRVYDFVFNGHHYKHSDSARDQGECPHCGERSNNGFYDPLRDADAFIGIKEVSEEQYLVCFECRNCYEKFFLHFDKAHYYSYLRREDDD